MLFSGLDTLAHDAGSVTAHTSPFTCRMREASSRPKREYKPKPRESFDLGEPEQSNGGFPAPKITGKVWEGPCFPRASETGLLWGSPSLLPHPSPLQKGTRPHLSTLSPAVCFVCKQLRHLSDLLTSPSGLPAGACVSVPLPRFITVPSSLSWEGLSDSPDR